jgi:hypothetical protein
LYRKPFSPLSCRALGFGTPDTHSRFGAPDVFIKIVAYKFCPVKKIHTFVAAYLLSPENANVWMQARRERNIVA